MKIAVIVALDGEYKLVEELLGGTFGTLPNGNEVELYRCGIGKVNAAMGVTSILESTRPDVVISSGVAGSIDPSLKPLDVIVADSIAYHDVWCGPGIPFGQVQGLPQFFQTDRALFGKATGLPFESIRPGLIASGDRFIEKPDEIAAIKKLYPDALAVDMESGALAQVCHIYEAPFISFRIISDSGDGASYDDFWKTAGSESFTLLRAFLEAI